MDKREFLAWETAASDTIDFKRVYVDMADDLVAGLMLAQIVYYHLPAKNGKESKMCVLKEGHYWVAKAHKEWHEECRITEWQAPRAISKLVEKNLVFVETWKFDGSPTTHIRINWDVFLKSLVETIDKSYDELIEEKRREKEGETSESPVSNLVKDQFPIEPNTSFQSSESPVSLTKSTTENTTETTAETKIRADGAGDFFQDKEPVVPDMTDEEFLAMFKDERVIPSDIKPLTEEEQQEKLADMGIVGDDPLKLAGLSPERKLSKASDISKRLEAEGIDMPLDWLVATSVMRGKEHLRDQYEKRKEMERQGRDIETEHAVANMRGWMPAAYVDMAVVFIEKTNIKPTESEKSGWIKAFSEMQQKGINPKDIRDGINRMKDQGLTINSPFSVKANATSMMSIRKTEEARCLRND